MTDIDWDLIRANVGGPFLGKAMKDYPSRIVEEAAKDVLKYKPADWRSYMKSRCKELKNADKPSKAKGEAEAIRLCGCGRGPAIIGERCLTCHETHLDKNPEYKRYGQRLAEEIESEIHLEVGEKESYPTEHHWRARLIEVCGKRAKQANADIRYLKLFRNGYAAAKKAAERMEKTSNTKPGTGEAA